MSIFERAYETSDGEKIPLPAAINKYSDAKVLKKFASDAGYDPSLWADCHKATLREFFSHATVDTSNLNPQDIEWSPLKNAIRNKEGGLFPHDWEVFVERINNGVMNGLIDSNGNLIGTHSVLPKISTRLYDALNINEEGVQVYENSGGWMAEAHRGSGNYFALRSAASEKIKNRLLFSQSNGKGASVVNARDAWAVVSWRKLPFAGALMGWRTGQGTLNEKFRLSSGLVIPLSPKELYTGKNISFVPDSETGEVDPSAIELLNDPSFLHDKFKLWTNDLPKALKFEAKIREGLRLDEESTSSVVDYAYERWLKEIEKDSVYKANGNGGKLDTGSTGWAEFTGALPGPQIEDVA